jgi:hypothetical protein
MLDWSQCPTVERSPDRVSGNWVFRGTRVPVRALFENLESGAASLEEFLDWFPGAPGYRENRRRLCWSTHPVASSWRESPFRPGYSSALRPPSSFA